MRSLLAAIAALLAVHVALGLLVHHHGALGIDRAAFDAIDHLRTQTGVDVVRVVTHLGSFPVVAVVVLAAAIASRDVPTAVRLIAGFALTVALVSLTKELWDRPRPPHRLAHVATLSYPSGHSAYAAVLLATATTTGKRAVIAAAAALLIAIGLSRLYLHVHYLTDVLGGFALAGAVMGTAFIRRA